MHDIEEFLTVKQSFGSKWEAWELLKPYKNAYTVLFWDLNHANLYVTSHHFDQWRKVGKLLNLPIENFSLNWSFLRMRGIVKTLFHFIISFLCNGNQFEPFEILFAFRFSTRLMTNIKNGFLSWSSLTKALSVVPLFSRKNPLLFLA